MNIREELNRILFIALTYIIALSVVTMVVAPVQRMFIPEVTLFAALPTLPNFPFIPALALSQQEAHTTK